MEKPVTQHVRSIHRDLPHHLLEGPRVTEQVVALLNALILPAADEPDQELDPLKPESDQYGATKTVQRTVECCG